MAVVSFFIVVFVVFHSWNKIDFFDSFYVRAIQYVNSTCSTFSCNCKQDVLVGG